VGQYEVYLRYFSTAQFHDLESSIEWLKIVDVEKVGVNEPPTLEHNYVDEK